MLESRTDRCSACKGDFHCIPPDGPVDASIYCIAERPGKDEQRNAERGYRHPDGLKNLLGQSGMELNLTYLPLAGLDRADLRVANTVWCSSPLDKKPTPREVSACSEHHLRADFLRTKPRVVLLMGATACSLVPSIDLHTDHGIPMVAELWGHRCWIVPSYHPALGLRSTGMMIPLLEDFRILRRWLEEEDWQWAVDEYPDTDYRLATSLKVMDDYFERYSATVPSPIAIDTESHAGRWFSIQVSVKEGTGLMVLLDNELAVTHLRMYLLSTVDWFTFHHAPADIPILEWVLQQKVEGYYIDTMQRAYHLGSLRQGLKALGLRLCGVRMKSWSDLVTPYSRDVLIDYLVSALEVAEGRRVITERWGKPTKAGVSRRLKDDVQSIPEEGIIRALIRYTVNSATYDPWAKLRGDKTSGQEDGDDLGMDSTSMDSGVNRDGVAASSAGDGAEETGTEEVGRYERLAQWLQEESGLGRWPDRGIAHVPIDEAVRYASMDADISLRIARKLEQRRIRFEKEIGVQEYDYDR